MLTFTVSQTCDIVIGIDVDPESLELGSLNAEELEVVSVCHFMPCYIDVDILLWNNMVLGKAIFVYLHISQATLFLEVLS